MTTSLWDKQCDIEERQLLQCVVEVAKAAFRAEASSVFVVDDDTGDLVFEAVAGRGEDHLIGTRFSGDTGIAGWAVATGQPLLVDDLADTPFSQTAAEQTGYVPQSVAAAPLYRHGRCIGVLEVLDRRVDRDELMTLELLGLLASQAAVGLELLQRVRRANQRHSIRSFDGGSNTALIDRISRRLSNLTADEASLLGQVLTFADDVTDKAAARGTSD
jgi:GAF domain-containing protein